jgi:hypothetical protein
MIKWFIAFNFLLIVCGNSYSQNICNLEKKIDKYEDKTSYKTSYDPFLRAYLDINKKDTVIYLSLTSFSGALSTNINGLYIILNNGKILRFPDEEVSVEAGEDGNFEYSTLMKISKDILFQLSQNIITDYKLYVYDWQPSPANAKRFQHELKCLLEI